LNRLTKGCIEGVRAGDRINICESKRLSKHTGCAGVRGFVGQGTAHTSCGWDAHTM